jgi:hypothetical protein
VEVALDALALGIGDLDQTRARGAQLVVGSYALGDVPEVTGEGRRARERDPRDRQLDRELGAVAAHAAQLEPTVEDHAVFGLEEPRQPPPVGIAKGGRHDQLSHLAADGFVRAVAERRLGSVVPADHATVRVHRHDRVEGRLEHGAQARLARTDLLLDAAACHELADLASQSTHRRQQAFVGLAQLPGEELHDADHATRAAQGEREAGMEPAATSRFRAREVGVLGRVHHPRRLSVCEHAPGKPFARPEHERFAERQELLRRHAGVPGSHAAQALLGGVELPDGAEPPAERATDRLQGRLVDLDRPFRFREDPGDSMLDTAELAWVGDRPAIRRRSRHDLERRYTR